MKFKNIVYTCSKRTSICVTSLYNYSWMGRGIIDVPLREMAEFLKDIENNMSWDNNLVVSTVELLPLIPNIIGCFC